MATNINSKNLIALLNEGKEISKQFNVTDQLILNSKNVQWNFVELADITFNEIVKIENVDLVEGIKFINCSFKKGIVFSGVLVSRINPDFKAGSSSIEFHSCNSTSIIVEKGCKFRRSLLIKDCEYIDDISIRDSEVDNLGYSIQNSKINRSLRIQTIKCSVRLFNSNINAYVTLKNVKGDVAFVGCEFQKTVRLWKIIGKSIVLNDNKFQNTFITEASIINGFYSHRDVAYRKFEIELTGGEKPENIKLEELYIEGGKFYEKFKFDGMGKTIKKIDLPVTPSCEGLIRIENCKIIKANISGVTKNINIIFSRIEFQQLNMLNFTNSNNNLTFTKCLGNNESSFNASDCDLGTTRFNDFNFKSFNNIQIDNVEFSGILASNVTWFSESQINFITSNGKESDIHKRKREIFRQLKQALRSYGNQIDSLFFQAEELKAYRNELKVSGKYSFGDRLIMITSMTNNYGLNWIKPIWLIILITAFYYLFVIVFNSTTLSFYPSLDGDHIKMAIDEFYDCIGTFFKLFNPARRYSNTYGTINSNWIYFFDLLHRIILGIFIFQIIKAFRKFVSK